MSDNADVRTLTTGVVYEDQWMRLRRDDIERRDGSRGTYAFVDKPDFALVIPAENDGFHPVDHRRLDPGRVRAGADQRSSSHQRRRGANRSPSRSTRARTVSAVKNSCSGRWQACTSSQLTGVETVGLCRARSE